MSDVEVKIKKGVSQEATNQTDKALESVVKEISLDSIYVDSKYQIRHKTNPEVVKRYINSYFNNAEMPHLKVADIDGALILYDGFHRYEALREVGAKRAWVTIVKTDLKEMKWLAGLANINHGVPLNYKERLKTFRAYIQAKKHIKEDGSFKSYREIAKDFGCVTHNTIRNWMMEFYPSTFKKISENWFNSKVNGNDTNSDSSMHSLACDGLEKIKQACDSLMGIEDEEKRDEARRMMYEAITKSKTGSSILN